MVQEARNSNHKFMWMKNPIRQFGLGLLFASVLGGACSPNNEAAIDGDPKFKQLNKWETAFDRSVLLEEIDVRIAQNNPDQELPVITVDENAVFQEMDGFGYTLNGGSAMLIETQLSEEKKESLLEELFSRKENAIGVNFLR